MQNVKKIKKARTINKIKFRKKYIKKGKIKWAMGWKNKNAKSVIGKKIGERDFGNKNGEKELRYTSTESEIM